MSILQVTDLKKYYGTEPNITKALDGISLSIDEGEFVAIVGTSGSGKSTLLNMMGGLDIPTSGNVKVRGKELSGLKDEQLTIFRRHNIGFIFQNYNLVPVLNVYENIVLPVELDGDTVDKKFFREIAEMLDKTGLQAADKAIFYEIEKEILERQERVLKTIPGVIDCESTARESSAYITLMFDKDVPVNDAILLVANKLNEVSGYPDNINQPTIRAANTDTVSVVDLMLLTDDTNKRSIDEYLSFFEETIKPYFDRIKGVADVSYWGGRARQIHIDVDPYRLSAYNITLSAIISALKQENVNISAGTIDFGAKDYRFRTIGEAKTPQDIRDIVVISSDNARIKLNDIAQVDYGFSKRNTIVSYGNTNALSVGIVAQAGANVLELTNDVDKVVENLKNCWELGV